MADVNAILSGLRAELGKPYVWGATGPNSFDCSGLVQYIYGQNGIILPRTSAAQSKVGTRVPNGQQQPGDLVFSNWEGGSGVSHVAVYIGGGQVIEAPEPGQNVKVTPLSPSYMAHVLNIQRVTGVTGTAGAAFSGSATGTATDPYAGITGALQGIGQSFGQISSLADSMNKLAMPTWWVRIIAGVAGVSLVFFGMWKLVGEVRD